jgi:hypothetical protein
MRIDAQSRWVQGLFEDVEKVRTSAISRYQKPTVVYVVEISVSAGGIMSI